MCVCVCGCVCVCVCVGGGGGGGGGYGNYVLRQLCIYGNYVVTATMCSLSMDSSLLNGYI